MLLTASPGSEERVSARVPARRRCRSSPANTLVGRNTSFAERATTDPVTTRSGREMGLASISTNTISCLAASTSSETAR